MATSISGKGVNDSSKQLLQENFLYPTSRGKKSLNVKDASMTKALGKLLNAGVLLSKLLVGAGKRNAL